MKCKYKVLVSLVALVCMLVVSTTIGYGSTENYKSTISEMQTDLQDLDRQLASQEDLLEEIKEQGYLKQGDIRVKTYAAKDLTFEPASYQTVSLDLTTKDSHNTLISEGWVPKGVTSYLIDNSDNGGGNSSYCIMNNYYLKDNNTVTFRVRCTTKNNQAKVNLETTVLYVKGK